MKFINIEAKQFLFTLEMKSMGDHGKENAENEIDTYEEVETDRGEHNDGIYDDSLPSSAQNTTASSSGIFDNISILMHGNLLVDVPVISSSISFIS